MKEPHYFASDFPNRREVESQVNYDRLYQDATRDQLRGDGSAYYLNSRMAVPAILERRPDAKIIVLVRNPVDMFVSWHNELLNALDEDEPNPERAWRLQEQRLRGERIPRYCKEPLSLQYQQFCSLGQQVEGDFLNLVEI